MAIHFSVKESMSTSDQRFPSSVPRIGFTESLQWVWAPLWIGKWATAESLPIWMNLSGSFAQFSVHMPPWQFLDVFAASLPRKFWTYVCMLCAYLSIYLIPASPIQSINLYIYLIHLISSNLI